MSEKTKIINPYQQTNYVDVRETKFPSELLQSTVHYVHPVAGEAPRTYTPDMNGQPLIVFEPEPEQTTVTFTLNGSEGKG